MARETWEDIAVSDDDKVADWEVVVDPGVGVVDPEGVVDAGGVVVVDLSITTHMNECCVSLLWSRLLLASEDSHNWWWSRQWYLPSPSKARSSALVLTKPMEKAKVEQKFEKKGGLNNNLVLLIASAVVDLTQDMSSCYCHDM